ncbi:MAG: hypothetical protein GY898_11765 [Proteobacteria bacterium]|nr:hypothetical protein [Pseudomonadota bacterium]
MKQRPAPSAKSLLVLLFVAAGCVGPVVPVAPSADDPAYTVALDRAWSIVANDLTAADNLVGWSVQGPLEDADLRVWLDGELASSGAASSIDVSGVAPGEHELLFALEDADVAFAGRTFTRSHPLYVLVSVDWDRADTGNSELDWQDELHEAHPALRLTHFVGPYTFTDPDVPPERVDELVAWLAAQESDHGDEVGLHIHPYCNFVETTSVTCRHEPSYVYDDGDESGYTVLSSAYTEAEYTELLLAADALFEARGFAKPTSFRAGGWIADEGVLQALATAGYVADTSANNWRLMEEWEDSANGLLWEWSQEHWGPIDSTSQPYYPSVEDAAVPGTPSIPILEVPDNGILADYVEADEMIAVLDANWGGGALSQPTAFSIGYHNRTQGLGFNFRDNIEDTLTHVDGFLAQDDAGPLIYATLSEPPRVWPAP